MNLFFSRPPRVTLEPVLERQAALWTPARRRSMAAKLERWARQLRVSAAILEADQVPRSEPTLKFVRPAKARLN